MRQRFSSRLASLLVSLVLLLTASTALAQRPPHPKQGRTVDVQAVPGDDYASGTALIEAQEEAAAAGGRWLLELGPGTYDLAERNLVMSELVSIEGAGMESTLITGVGQGFSNLNLGLGVIVGADGSRLSEVTIQCRNHAEAGQEFCIGIANYQASPRVHRVRVVSEGAGSHWGIRNVDSSPILEEVEILAFGGINNYAVVAVGRSFPEIQRSILTGRDGSDRNVAVFGEGGGRAARIDDSELYASGGTHAMGIYSDSTSGPSEQPFSILDDVQIRAEGGDLTAGIYGGNHQLLIQGTVVTALGPEGLGIQMDPLSEIVVTDTQLLAEKVAVAGGVVELGATRLQGETVTAGRAVCTGVYRFGADPAFFASECPKSDATLSATIKISEIR